MTSECASGSRPSFGHIRVAIDASRNRSGGAIAHMKGFIGAADPEKHGIRAIHVWSYEDLLDALPECAWLVKHSPRALQGGILKQLQWQRFDFPKEIESTGCHIVLNTDAGSVNRFRPSVTMSRDMLSYEPGEINRYGISKARLRLEILREVQNRALRSADAVIFLTDYASRVIQSRCGPLQNSRIIPHGVSEEYRDVALARDTRKSATSDVRCLYVSNTAPYKHQWQVVKAVESLRTGGVPILLHLVGGGSGPAQEQLSAQIRESDPLGHFVTRTGFVGPDQLLRILNDADLFVFASSCENMPNTLIEAMSSGLPIACSDRGPMPEVLRDGGLYFDPEDPRSIASAIHRLIGDSNLRRELVTRARAYASEYSWLRCADETLSYLTQICLRICT